MKLLSVIKKSLLENYRSFWLLILTISLTPFFIAFYWFVSEAEKVEYKVLLLNRDVGIESAQEELNYGKMIMEESKDLQFDSLPFPMTLEIAKDYSSAIDRLKDKKADALIIFPEEFTERFQNIFEDKINQPIEMEFVGDLSNIKYMISAIWAEEIFTSFVYEISNQIRPISIKETSLGISGKLDEFDMYVPGLLMLAIIMLMLPASITLVHEVEHQTMIRLKLSNISTFEYLIGLSTVQVLIGIISIGFSLLIAVGLGFEYTGSLVLVFIIALITSISVIGLSLMLAAVCKTANEILIVGNFPLFLLMFFTGVAIPINPKVLFSIANYPITFQGIMSPTHSVNAMNKIMIMDMGFVEILPEIIALIILSVSYFALGIWMFWKRHMKL